MNSLLANLSPLVYNRNNFPWDLETAGLEEWRTKLSQKIRLHYIQKQLPRMLASLFKVLLTQDQLPGHLFSWMQHPLPFPVPLPLKPSGFWLLWERKDGSPSSQVDAFLNKANFLYPHHLFLKYWFLAESAEHEFGTGSLSSNNRIEDVSCWPQIRKGNMITNVVDYQLLYNSWL